MNRLRDLRNERDVTLHTVAQALGVSIATVHCLEKGTRIPSFDTIAKLCRYFSVYPHYLWPELDPTHDAAGLLREMEEFG